jgi:hypothetical protein
MRAGRLLQINYSAEPDPTALARHDPAAQPTR